MYRAHVGVHDTWGTCGGELYGHVGMHDMHGSRVGACNTRMGHVTHMGHMGVCTAHVG